MSQSQSTTAQKRIKSALAELLAEESLQALTVSSIARRAKVNRGTFYLHYTDKFDLMRSLAETTVNDVSAILWESDDVPTAPHVEVIPHATVVRLLEYLRSDIAFIQALIGPNGVPTLAERLKAIVIHDLRRRLELARAIERSEQPTSHTVLDMPTEYLDELVMASVISVILLWIRRGAIESPEQVADLVTAVRRLSPLDLLNMAFSTEGRS